MNGKLIAVTIGVMAAIAMAGSVSAAELEIQAGSPTPEFGCGDLVRVPFTITRKGVPQNFGLTYPGKVSNTVISVASMGGFTTSSDLGFGQVFRTGDGTFSVDVYARNGKWTEAGVMLIRAKYGLDQGSAAVTIRPQVEDMVCPSGGS